MFKNVLLVDFNDNAVGAETKENAHKKPLLHRAFSIFLVNGNKVLLQCRAKNKYHSGGLIANSCCSHPITKEDILIEAKQRLNDELGIDYKDALREVGTFVYYKEFNKNLYEYELDHVIVGNYSGKFNINKEEVEWIDWFDIDFVKKDIRENPDKYCAWFFNAFKIFIDSLNK